MKRVAAVDIGSNSTRLLITDGTRESIVTRLGEGVDATGRLGEAPMQRVLDVLHRYKEQIDGAPAAAVMTSAVRDAQNGPEFARRVQDTLGFPARILSGDEEAELTFTGATAQRDDQDPVLVIDIGGGSTELVIGRRDAVTFHVSTQIGVVRHSERHLRNDPPTAQELQALRADVTLPEHPPATRAIAVAGTPTQCAAIDLGLDEYDPARIEGHILTATRLNELYADLASKPLAERQKTRGLDPARAPVIVAGIAILLEVMASFGLAQVEASEHDILYGLALSTLADAP
ncbi:Ppx/GppA family phosphatase [Solirubrobacter phytolaccae]|uniref:Ppx/GppA family phosphatase n=1 Tax=Solirubrobacter phytolaccae TaxID=1404360 RepID=A0A9X3NKW4_9ACTN|nr:Ppx/GppA phosphatase family protein [Solirubrobacter phytolaccae]MDA0183312.1 Ppx/GppA family phosphatase [Solirubrobacter phytolaccae]